MSDPVDLSVRPTVEQVARFRALTPAERYAWLANVLRTVHALAPREAQARWRALKQAQSGGFLSIVCALARALDRAEFESAARCLNAECVYESPTGVLRGVEPIVASYLESHARATQRLDRIRYQSRVEGTAPGVAVITYEDHIQHRGRSHVYRCRQEVSVGRSRLVERIVHHEIEDEQRRLDLFLAGE